MLCISGPESLGVEVVNIDSIKEEVNTEIGMQLLSDVLPDEAIFYSDMNGFTIHKVVYL